MTARARVRPQLMLADLMARQPWLTVRLHCTGLPATVTLAVTTVRVRLEAGGVTGGEAPGGQRAR